MPAGDTATLLSCPRAPLDLGLPCAQALNVMNFEWDPDKQRANLRKHGIELADAVAVFRDPLAVTVEDRSHQEERFVTLGMDSFGRILVVVYVYRDRDTIRLISVRKADAGERKQYRL